MPRTKFSARRSRPKPYDHTRPRLCCIMMPPPRVLVLDHSLEEKLETIVKMCDEINELDSTADDDYNRMRRDFIHKNVVCIQKLAEKALNLNRENICGGIRA